MNFTRIGLREGEWNRYTINYLHSVIKREFPQIEIIRFRSLKEINPYEKYLLLYSPTLIDAKEIAEELRKGKKIFRRSRFVAGGPVATGIPEFFIKSGFDLVIQGEGEEAIIRIIKNGIENTQIIIKGKPLKSIDKYFTFIDEGIGDPVELIRGCPFHCSFCQTPALYNHFVRYRSIDSVIEVAQYKIARGINFISFIAPNALGYYAENNSLEKIETLLMKLKQTGMKEIILGFFPSEVRPEFVKPEAMEIIKKYCSNKKIVIGGQSGSNRILKLYKRGHTIEDVISAVEIIKEAGLNPIVDFIIGFPDETIDDMKLTIEIIGEFIYKLNININLHYFIPLPGSELSGRKPADIPSYMEKKLDEYDKTGHLRGNWKKQRYFTIDFLFENF